MIEFNDKWKYIPRELLHIILNYDGKISYRSGIYMNQIPRNEKRDKLLNKIPIKKYKIQEKLQANVELSKKKWLFLRTLEDNEMYLYYVYLYKGGYYQEVHKIE